MYFNHIYPQRKYIKFCECSSCNLVIDDDRCMQMEIPFSDYKYLHKDCFFDEFGKIWWDEDEGVICSECGRVVEEPTSSFYVSIEGVPVCEDCLRDHWEILTPDPEEVEF